MKTQAILTVLCAMAIFLAAAGGSDAASASRKLWSQGNRSVWAVPCPHHGDIDTFCAALEVRAGNTTTGPVTDPAYGFMPALRVRWKQEIANAGPDLIVEGDSGGSSDDLDVFGITFDPAPHLQRLASSHFDPVFSRSRDSLPHFELGFAIEGFNQASNAATATIGLPIRWNGQALELDLKALLDRTISAGELARARAQAAQELGHILAAGGSTDTPMLSQTMLRLTMSGHADQARAFLEAVWPPARNRKAAIAAEWSSFCVYIVMQDGWKAYRLSRIPQANLILAAAAQNLVPDFTGSANLPGPAR